MFHNVTLQDDSSVEKQLAKRQLTVKSNKSNNWYIHVKKTLMKYELNDIQDYLETPLKKITWKKKVNGTINRFWEKEFKTIIPFYKNLQYLNIENLKLGQLHPLLKVNV